MNDKRPVEQTSALNVGDIYYVLFRQKWIILSCFAIGLLAAAALYVIKPALYESAASVYVQYVAGVRAPTQNSGDPAFQVTDPNGGNVLNTELEFLTSQDLAREVVTNLGAERILAAYGAGNNTNAAVGVVIKNLIKDDAPKTPSIIHIAFQHPDPDVAREVLQEIIVAYINRSADMHRPVQVSPESLTLEIDRMRDKIAETEKSLRQAKQEAGIISSLEDTRKALNGEFDKVKAEILDEQIKLSVYGAVPQEVVKTNAATAEVTTNAPADIPAAAVEEYSTARAALEMWQVRRVEGMTKWPAGSPLFKDVTDNIANWSEKKRLLESQYSGLAGMGSAVAVHVVGSNPGVTASTDGQNDLNGGKAKITFLEKQLAEIKKAQLDLDGVEPNIVELERRKEVEMSQRSLLLANYEHAMSAENQNNSGGIKIDESPTPAVKKHSKTFKKLLMMALAGPIAGGLALAFLIEMVLDRSIRRPGEIETKLHLPVFITIPEINANGNGKGHRRLALPGHNRRLLKDSDSQDESLVPAVNGNSGNTAAAGVAPWDHDNALHRYYAGLRDRLIVNFEVRNLNHNPKLVAVTSCGRGAGVSSIAAGLAASLSETGDGNVLLVNMRGDQGDARHFFNGKPACGLDAALASETKENAFVQENLYVASEGGNGGNLPKILPKRFASLMPKLKASDFDYIIFDMPPVSQTSVTPRLSGLMDMVLLVIESEKTNRDTVQRATALLAESKANVSTVLNKVRAYVPPQLQHELPD